MRSDDFLELELCHYSATALFSKSVSVHTRTHLAHTTYFWAFIAVLLGSTFGRPSSENGNRDGRPDTSGPRRGDDPKFALIQYERSMGMYLGLETGMNLEEKKSMDYW